MRDAQKSKVYKAEHVLRAHADRLRSTGGDAGSVQDIDPKLSESDAVSLLDHVANATKDHADPWIASRADIKLTLRFPATGKTAFYRGSESLISLPKSWALRTSVVLHEYAHHLTYRDVPNHGSVFVSRFLDLLDVHAPACVPILRAAYDDGGVRYLPGEESKHVLAYAKKVRQESRSATGELPYVSVLARTDKPGTKGTDLHHGYLFEVDSTGLVLTRSGLRDPLRIPRTDLLALSQSDRHYRP